MQMENVPFREQSICGVGVPTKLTLMASDIDALFDLDEQLVQTCPQYRRKMEPFRIEAGTAMDSPGITFDGFEIHTKKVCEEFFVVPPGIMGNALLSQCRQNHLLEVETKIHMGDATSKWTFALCAMLQNGAGEAADPQDQKRRRGEPLCGVRQAVGSALTCVFFIAHLVWNEFGFAIVAETRVV